MSHHHCLTCLRLTPRPQPFCPRCLERLLALLLS
jgi:RNA polymerase subunit RPABC4/transcription elongation factor Spt4